MLGEDSIWLGIFKYTTLLAKDNEDPKECAESKRTKHTEQYVVPMVSFY